MINVSTDIPMILHLDLELNLDIEGMISESVVPIKKIMHNSKTCTKEATNKT